MLLAFVLAASPLCAKLTAALDSAAPIKLEARPDCDAAAVTQAVRAGSAEAPVTLATLGDRLAAVRAEGPGGSGHFWVISVAVKRADGSVAAACLET